MNVLSLFDGMSCAQIALERAGVKVDNYFACEIDKWAIHVAKQNYPSTRHLGSVIDFRPHDDGYFDLPKIDLLIGGSPCQDLSVAGRGKGLAGERSGLFFEYVRILNELREVNPDLVFILENVKMKQEYQDIITQELGVEPILIDSALVSAQSRKRLYWTNLGVAQPEDRGLVLADVLEDGFVDREKSYCIDANYWKGGSVKGYLEKRRRQLVFGESPSYHQSEKRLMVQTKPLQCGHADDIKGHDFLRRVYHPAGKSPTLTTLTGGNQHRKVALDDVHYRKLTPLECERLQTVPDGYTDHVSNTQRYKMLGNGFTVDVIAHILKSTVLSGQDSVV